MRYFYNPSLLSFVDENDLLMKMILLLMLLDMQLYMYLYVFILNKHYVCNEQMYYRTIVTIVGSNQFRR